MLIISRKIRKTPNLIVFKTTCIFLWPKDFPDPRKCGQFGFRKEFKNVHLLIFFIWTNKHLEHKQNILIFSRGRNQSIKHKLKHIYYLPFDAFHMSHIWRIFVCVSCISYEIIAHFSIKNFVVKCHHHHTCFLIQETGIQLFALQEKWIKNSNNNKVFP